MTLVRTGRGRVGSGGDGEDTVAAILAGLGLDVVECRRLPRPHQGLVNHYLIECQSGRYFLKVARPGRNRRPRLLRHVIKSPSLERQIAVYHALASQQFSAFRYPELVNTDQVSYLLLEFVAAVKANEKVPAATDLIESLHEFQFAGTVPAHGTFGNLLLHFVLNPTVSLATRVLTQVRRRFGLRTSLRCLRVLARCHASERNQRVITLVHNDFHPENILVEASGRLYFTDFENVTTTRKWLLLDIVHYAVATQEAEVDTELIREYLAKLGASSDRLKPINAVAQVRLALLRRVMQHATSPVPPAAVREAYSTFLEEVLLSDAAFDAWFKRHFS